MRLVGHVAGMGKRRGTYGARRGNLREKDDLEDVRVDGMVILKWIFKKQN
jgi:hypothetical protein